MHHYIRPVHLLQGCTENRYRLTLACLESITSIIIILVACVNLLGTTLITLLGVGRGRKYMDLLSIRFQIAEGRLKKKSCHITP